MANSVNRYFEGLLVGGTLGFVFGLLTAPKPGSELRRELAESADDMLSQASGNWLEIKDKMNEHVQPLADRAGVYRERMGEKLSVMKDRAEELKEKYGEKASELKERYGEKAQELKEKANEKIGELKNRNSQSQGGSGADLLNNYMGNNSGPMYTAGNKVSPNASATPVSDSCSNYSAGKAEGGAAGG